MTLAVLVVLLEVALVENIGGLYTRGMDSSSGFKKHVTHNFQGESVTMQKWGNLGLIIRYVYYSLGSYSFLTFTKLRHTTPCRQPHCRICATCRESYIIVYFTIHLYDFLVAGALKTIAPQ